MGEVRKTWSPEEKAKAVAYAAEHGVAKTAEHLGLKPTAAGMIRRWQHKASGTAAAPRKAVARNRKWTDKKVAKLLEYLKIHTVHDTMARFKVSSAQIYMWKNGLTYADVTRKRNAKANGAANGLGVLDVDEKDALMWLERWRSAYFDRLKAETPSAASVLAALRGGAHKRSVD